MAKNSQTMTSRRRRQALTAEGIRQWVRESRNELRKVTWPTPEQTRNLTLVVIAVCVIMGAFLGIVDAVLGYLVRLIIGY
jgi:preprotein translocase subunit SecE